ncbi:MAG: PP2C family protein-serine/threonine phosphatase [Fluviicola sp.]|nr:PP2C family protein-serine/threonine phosphatase [Fluviicola sp.]
MVESFVKSLENQLQLKDFKLNSLLDITKAINTNQNVGQLMQLFEFIIHEQLGYDKFLLFNKQDGWDCILRKGFKKRVNDYDIPSELGRFKEITMIESTQSHLLSEFDVIVPVFHKEQALAYFLIKGVEYDGRHYSNELNYMSFIQTLINIIVVAVENKRMAKINVHQERYRRELEIASSMQKMLFPDDLPTNKQMDISAKYKPRHEVGGDYYDFIQLKEDEYVICIADVSGKGVSAAMLMANFQATIRTLFEHEEFNIKLLMEELNQKVMKNAKGEKFITFFLSHYDANSRKLTYVNAGHNHPFITNGKTIKELDQGCIGLGMLEELPFMNVGEQVLEANTTIVLYTDGVVELENDKEEFFGTERLVKLVNSYYPLSMEDMNSLIFSKLDEWKGDLDLVDDTAIFSCRFF